jgi:hypothetical protein
MTLLHPLEQQLSKREAGLWCTSVILTTQEAAAGLQVGG